MVVHGTRYFQSLLTVAYVYADVALFLFNFPSVHWIVMYYHTALLWELNATSTHYYAVNVGCKDSIQF